MKLYFKMGLGIVLFLFLAFTTTAIAHHGSDMHDENLISQEYEVVRSEVSVERSVEGNEEVGDVQVLYQDVDINEKDWIQFKEQPLEASNNSASTGRNPQTGKEIQIAASTGGGMGKVTVTSLEIQRPAQTSCYSSAEAIHCGVEREDDRTIWCWGKSCEASIQSDEEGSIYCWGRSCPAQAIECPSCQEEYEHARSQSEMREEWNLEGENVDLLSTVSHEDNIYFALLSDVDVEVGELNLDSKSISSKTISSSQDSDEHESDMQTLSFFNVELASGTISPDIYAHCGDGDNSCVQEVASQCPNDSCVAEAAAHCSDGSCVAEVASHCSNDRCIAEVALDHCRDDRCFAALADHCMDDRCLEALASARRPPETITQQGRILDSNETRAVLDEDRDMEQATSENEITSRVLLPPNISQADRRASAALSAGNMTRGISPLDISQEDRNIIREHLSSVQNPTSADFGLAVAYTASQNERVKSIRYDEERNVVEIEHEEDLRLFGIFNVKADSKTTIHSDGVEQVRRPWWSFLASKPDTSSFRRASANVLQSIYSGEEALAIGTGGGGGKVSVDDFVVNDEPAHPDGFCDWCTWCC